MVRRLSFFFGLFFTLGAQNSYGGFYGGASLNVVSLMPIPAATGVSGSPGFGLGTVHAGFNLLDILGLGLYVSSDATGNVTGTGSFLGTSGTIDGRFRLIHYGIEARVSPPTFPLYFRASIGLSSMRSEFTVTGAPVDPFASIRSGLVTTAGIGFGIPLPFLRIFAEFDGVYAGLDSTSLPAGIALPGLLYFKGLVGVLVTL